MKIDTRLVISSSRRVWASLPHQTSSLTTSIKRTIIILDLTTVHLLKPGAQECYVEKARTGQTIFYSVVRTEQKHFVELRYQNPGTLILRSLELLSPSKIRSDHILQLIVLFELRASVSYRKPWLKYWQVCIGGGAELPSYQHDDQGPIGNSMCNSNPTSSIHDFHELFRAYEDQVTAWRTATNPLSSLLTGSSVLSWPTTRYKTNYLTFVL